MTPSLYRDRLEQMALGFALPTNLAEPLTADELVAQNAERVHAFGRLAKLSTVKDRHGPIAVKSQELFRRPRASVRVPLNVKTTQNERKVVPLDQLEPTQDKIPVDGLRAYIKSSRRDPADVLHVVMHSGKERLIIQEGHTRLGVAVLRGQTEAEVRVWEFIENAAGDLEPVPRGLQKRGLERAARALTYREKLVLLLDGKPVSDVAADTQVINLPMGEYADFDDCVAKNQDKESPEGYCAVIHKAINGNWPANDIVSIQVLDRAGKPIGDRIDMPDISDVSFPTMIGAIKEKPPAEKRKKRKGPVNYHGVRLGRWPMKFEAQILALTEIPPRLDAAVVTALEHPADLRLTMQDVADYGAVQVLHELVRQGAPTYILERPPVVDITACWERLISDRTAELQKAEAYVEGRVGRRRLNADRHKQIVRLLFDRSEPRIIKRFARRAVNDAFTFGRAVTITAARRPRGEIALAYRDEEGHFISIIEAVNSGQIAVDVVVQTAVMDTATCEECADVDGEEMELGDDRQQELHPPYIKCLGGDDCRCVQIAILENGMEINVDEIDEDTIP